MIYSKFLNLRKYRYSQVGVVFGRLAGRLCVAAEQNSQICAALFYKSDVLRNDILIHKELNKNIFFLQDILMPRIYVKCKNCLNFGCAEERPPQSGFFNDTKIERN